MVYNDMTRWLGIVGRSALETAHEGEGWREAYREYEFTDSVGLSRS